MRFYEIIAEADEFDDMIEDEADARGDSVLATALEELRNRAGNVQEPKVRVDSLVNLIKRLPRGEAFSAAALADARKNNTLISNQIEKIEDDDAGVKYVYLKPAISEPFADNDIDTDDAAAAKSQKVVDQMASRAAG